MLNRLMNLVDVKSIMTLVLTAGFVALTMGDRISGEQYLTIYTVIIGFYFGTQSMKRTTTDGKKE